MNFPQTIYLTWISSHEQVAFITVYTLLPTFQSNNSKHEGNNLQGASGKLIKIIQFDHSSLKLLRTHFKFELI